MSNFSDLSKQVGWDKIEVPAPTVAHVNQLSERILHGDKEAMREVIAIQRFAPSPTTVEETQAINLNVANFKLVRAICDQWDILEREEYESHSS